MSGQLNVYDSMRRIHVLPRPRLLAYTHSQWSEALVVCPKGTISVSDRLRTLRTYAKRLDFRHLERLIFRPANCFKSVSLNFSIMRYIACSNAVALLRCHSLPNKSISSSWLRALVCSATWSKHYVITDWRWVVNLMHGKLISSAIDAVVRIVYIDSTETRSYRFCSTIITKIHMPKWRCLHF